MTKHLCRVATLIAAVLHLTQGDALFAASAIKRWHWTGPAPFGADVHQLVVSPAGFTLALCDRGQVFRSEDRVAWTESVTGFREELLDGVVFPPLSTSGRLIIVGAGGLVLQSADGIDFSASRFASTNWLTGIAASGDAVVIVGDQGALYTSSDTTNWTMRTISGNPWFRGVVWRPESALFAAVGEGGEIWTSANGADWTKRNSGVNVHLNRVTAGANGFIAVGNAGTVLTSDAQGVRWTRQNSGTTGDLYSVAVEQRVRGAVLVGGDGVLRSAVTAGNTFLWTDESDSRRQAPAPLGFYTAILPLTDGFFVGGDTGVMVNGSRGGTISALVWQVATSFERGWIAGMTTIEVLHTNQTAALSGNQPAITEQTVTNTIFVAAGNDATLLRSDSGRSWTAGLAPTNAAGGDYFAVASQPGRLVAVGSGGRIAHSPATWNSVISTNQLTNAIVSVEVLLTNRINSIGLAWYSTPSGVTNDLNDVATDGARWVAVGSRGMLLTSPDGLAWTRASSPGTNSLNGIAQRNGIWVAVGSAGAIWRSVDGGIWTVRPGTAGAPLWRVRAVSSGFLAVGGQGVVLTSPDGLVWTPGASGTTETLFDVCEAAGARYAVGGNGVVIQHSGEDGSIWKPFDSITRQTLQAVVVAENLLLAGGAEGATVRLRIGPGRRALSLVAYPRQSGENLFVVSGELEDTFRMEWSDDLLNWNASEVSEVSDPSGEIYLYEPGTGKSLKQFYRLIPSY